jgi:glycosidase
MNEDLALYKMAMAYVLTSNRIPQIFYGTEILMQSPKEGRHDGAVRGDFPGGWQGDKVNAFTMDNLSAEQTDALNFNKALMNYRAHSTAIISGSLTHYTPKNGVYVQFRQADNETLMIIYNKNQQAIELDLQRFATSIGQARFATDIITSQSYSLTTPLNINEKGVTILSLTNKK